MTIGDYRIKGRSPTVRPGTAPWGEKEGWWFGSTYQGLTMPYVDINPVFEGDCFVIWAPHLPTISQVGEPVGAGIGWGQWYAGGGAFRVEVTYIDAGNEPGLRITPHSGDEDAGFLIHLVHAGYMRFPTGSPANFPDG